MTSNNPIPLHVLNRRRRDESIHAQDSVGDGHGVEAAAAAAAINTRPEHAVELLETEKKLWLVSLSIAAWLQK